MSSLADQLKALGLESGKQTEPPTKPSKPRSERKPAEVVERQASPNEALLCRLPRFGTVSRLEEERGFGFLSAEGHEDVFFHFRGYRGRLPGGQKLPAVGSKVLFIAGSDPRRPNEPKKSAIEWAPFELVAPSAGSDVAGQALLDGLRRHALVQQPLEALWTLLEASWYSNSWRGAAPSDLEDAVLEQVLGNVLAAMSMTNLKKHRVGQRLAGSRYRFAARLSPTSVDCTFERLLELFNARQLSSLGAPNIAWLKKTKLASNTHARLLEWHLVSRSLTTPQGDWEKWFPGTDEAECDLATRFLDSDAAVDVFVATWLERLAHNGLVSEARADTWLNRRPDLAIALFQQLPAARQNALLSAWRKDPGPLDGLLEKEPKQATRLLTLSSLAFDLETDGERIWEVGCARNGKSNLLHDERSGTDLEVAMAELGQRVRLAPLLVGHNVLAWDWPIAARHIQSGSAPLIWDTLLVQYLLEPQASSHALGGNHRADGDALTALQLFEHQLHRLPASIARGILAGAYPSTEALLAAITDGLHDAVSYAREVPPDLVAMDQKGKVVILPEGRLREFDWVPGVTVVAADAAAGLQAPWRELDVAALEASIRERNEIGLTSRVLIAVARLTKAQGIALRRNMLPAWLVDGDPRLTSLVDGAAIAPLPEEGLCIASIPARVEWWEQTDLACYALADLSDDVLVLDRRQLAPSEVSKGGVSLPTASMMRVGTPGSAPLWLLADRAAHVLDPRGGINAFRTFWIGAHATTTHDGRAELSHKPLLATRRHHVLHPGAEDQASYWAEVLRTFREVAARDEGNVPILLIGSSRDRELLDVLATGLAELGMGEVKPVHRSQREHLLRASRKGLAVVAGIDQWPVWHALAESAGIDLQPVVEALPVEEWQACDEERSVASAGTGVGSPGVDPLATGEIVAIDPATTLEKTPALVEARLHGWLHEAGLADAHASVVLIDSRVGALCKGSTRIVEPFQLLETPLSADDLHRLAIGLSPFKVEREEAPEGYEAMEQFLVANWQPAQGKGSHQVTGFKASQRVAMEAICARSANVLVSLPTGEGKSVLFQVPALCRGLRNRRLTLVLSPLKALMRDQVERLREQGFSESADYLSGDRPPHEINDVIQGVLDHRIVLLYVAPERLRSEVFLDVLEKRMRSDGGLEHVVVDETHCVNQWGYEFRPDYFHALQLLLDLCRPANTQSPTPFILLSATTTASDRTRLQAILTGDKGAPGHVLPLLVRPEAFANPLRSHIAVRPERVRGYLYDRREFDKALAERLPFIQQAIADARRNRELTGQRSAVLVFASSRAHTEIVAQRLATVVGGQVDYYHAGLDAASREEIYTRFLDGELDVLVATKAFGMGMDIPDIHWVVHLSPPGYLEDFLQEVGRIGRGAKEREKAGLDKLSALLLCSDRDFESIREMRARSALTLPIIKELYQQAEKHAYELDGQRVVVVPSEGFSTSDKPPRRSAAAARAAATRVRMGLYWLERAGRARLCGSIADLLVVTIHLASLQRLAGEAGVVGEVAKAILEVARPESPVGSGIYSSKGTADLTVTSSLIGSSGAPGDGLLGGLMAGRGKLLGSFADMVGLLFGVPNAPRRSVVSASVSGSAVRRLPTSVPASPAATEPSVLVLNLSQLRLRSPGLRTIGDVLACLTDIERLGGVSLRRDVEIVPRKLASHPKASIDALFDYVDTAASELIRRLEVDGRIEFNPFEMVEDVEGPTVHSNEMRRLYERAFINGFRWLTRASGVRVRQLIRDDGKVIWQAILASSACGKANSRRERIRKSAQSLFDAVGGETIVPVATLIESLRSKSRDGRFRESDLGKAAGLLAAMNLVSISPDLVPLSHVVMLPDVDGQIESQAEIWDELNRVNELSEARNLAMEVFASVGEDAREAFIEGYFATSSAEELRQFLDTQLGEIAIEDGDEGVSTVISEMREKVRATKAVEFFSRFEQSEEPVQWEVARYPFDRHVLVNAGPGAGKTFVLVGRIAHLIRMQNIDPAQIVVLAFNRAVVFEIRRRIRELFRSLGYAAYASRLRVSTFHSFAIKNLARHGGVELPRSDVDGVLKTFSDRMERDEVFRSAVAGGVRSILVDEFQDVTDQVYAVVHNLYLGSDSRAGVMVIGDDDQDILRWQRKNDGSFDQFSEAYFERFAEDFGGDTLGRFTLGTNFRSGRVIVERSQSAISGLLERSRQTRRLKVDRLLPRTGAIEGEWRRFDWRGRAWHDAVEKTRAVLHGLEGRPQESVAVLCRTNAEVASAHRLLSQTSPHLTVQGGATLRVADFRHVGMWLDFLRDAVQEDDRALSEGAKKELVAKFMSTTSIPELASPETAEGDLVELWDLCCQEQDFPHLSTLVRFVGELRSDDLARLSGSRASEQFAIVSTLHKVKGLEFDNVVILPSTSSYGGKDKAGDAAEEARLLYVGMTRAKRHLTYFVGDREYCWGVADPIDFDGVTTDGRVLVGAMDDVALGWAMQQGPFNSDAAECQRYIESEVAVGDAITLGGVGGGAGKAFLHKSGSGRAVQVGFLAKKHGSGVRDASLRVSAVVRFRPDTFDDSVPDFVRARGWGYVVLVSGRLR